LDTVLTRYDYLDSAHSLEQQRAATLVTLITANAISISVVEYLGKAALATVDEGWMGKSSGRDG